MSTREKKGRFETQRGRKSCENEVKDWSYAAKSENQRSEPGKGQEGPLPGAFRGGVAPVDTLISDMWPLTVRECISVVIITLVCSHLLWEARKLAH